MDCGAGLLISTLSLVGPGRRHTSWWRATSFPRRTTSCRELQFASFRQGPDGRVDFEMLPNMPRKMTRFSPGEVGARLSLELDRRAQAEAFDASMRHLEATEHGQTGGLKP